MMEFDVLIHHYLIDALIFTNSIWGGLYSDFLAGDELKFTYFLLMISKGEGVKYLAGGATVRHGRQRDTQ